MAADVDAVAVARGLVAFELQPDQHPLRMLAPLGERVATAEVVALVGGYREADSRLERVDLVVELVTGEDQTGLDAEHVERLQPEWRQPVRLAGFEHRIPQRGRVLGMAEELVAELTRVAGAGDDQRDALRS